MAQYRQLNEDIVIDIQDTSENDKNKISITLRNTKNENTKITFDINNTKLIHELKKEIIKTIKVEEGKAMKLFFRGKPLKDEDTITHHKITNNDVILYMLIEEPKQDNNNLEVSVLASQMNSQEDSAEDNPNNRINRGFNRFRLLGMANSEIQLIRILFHTALITEPRVDPSRLTAEMFLEREERWLNENNPNLINGNENNNFNLNPNNPRAAQANRNMQALRIIDLRSGLQRPPMIIRTHLFMQNRPQNDFFLGVEQRESNFKFLLGFLLGTFLAIYALIFLIFCKFRPKFRSGLVAGMIFGSFLFLFYNLTNPNRN